MPIQIGGRKEAGFDDPLGLLKDCHRRIEHFLGLLVTVARQASDDSLEPPHREALDVAIRYFEQSAPKHTVDEEESLFPRLLQLQDPRARSVVSLLQNLAVGHGLAETMHRRVELLVRRWLSNGSLCPDDRRLLNQSLANMTDFYKAHIAAEEQQVFPLAAVVLTSTDLRSIGSEMANRRGVRVRSVEHAMV
ncbi:MAG TPA: hemerythrin domain-containing protein [Blastocatellia bacterium]|nr:hemerythrin domain-containing protein [Blastocatellia bacterium]